jgi:hypothetical protein
LKVNYIFIALLLIVQFLTAQNDTISETDNPFSDAFISHQIDAKFIEDKLEIDNSSTDVSYLFSSKKKNLGLSYNFDKTKYLNPNQKPIKNVLLAQKPLDDDILVIKHFQGKIKRNLRIWRHQIFLNTCTT